MKIWIIWWKYSDNSAFGIERVYDNLERANADFHLLEKTESAKHYCMESLEITK